MKAYTSTLSLEKMDDKQIMTLLSRISMSRVTIQTQLVQGVSVECGEVVRAKYLTVPAGKNEPELKELVLVFSDGHQLTLHEGPITIVFTQSYQRLT